MPQDYNVEDILAEVRRKRNSEGPPPGGSVSDTYDNRYGPYEEDEAPYAAPPHQQRAPLQQGTEYTQARQQRAAQARPARQQPARAPRAAEPEYSEFGGVAPVGSRRGERPSAFPVRARPEAGASQPRAPRAQPAQEAAHMSRGSQPQPGQQPARAPRAAQQPSAAPSRARQGRPAPTAGRTGRFEITAEEPRAASRPARKTPQFDFDADFGAQDAFAPVDSFGFAEPFALAGEEPAPGPSFGEPADGGLAPEEWEAREPFEEADAGFGFGFPEEEPPAEQERPARAPKPRARVPRAPSGGTQEVALPRAASKKGARGGYAAQEARPPEPEEDDPYICKDDAPDLEKELRSARKSLLVRLVLCGAFSVLSLYLALSLRAHGIFEKMGVPNGLLFLPDFMLEEGGELSMRVFLVCNLVVFLLAAGACYDVVGGGFTALCRLRANCDTPAALAVFGVLVQGIILAAFPDSVAADEGISLYFPVAAFALFFCLAGKRLLAGRMWRNFRLLDSDKEKYALAQIHGREFAREFSRGLGPDVDRVAYSVKGEFIGGFVPQSYSGDYSESFSRFVPPICLAASLLVGVLTYVLSKEMPVAVSAFAAVLCVCAPFSGAILPNLMLSRVSKRLARRGAMLAGYEAAEDYSETGAVVISDRDLFSEDSVMLHGMKVFAEKRIDEAILDAASVILSCNGVMSGVFLNMIGGNRRMLKSVDSLVYEDGMGISAWVDGKRVLIGSQELMRQHGVDSPSKDFESRYVRDGRQVLYLSNSGELTAMFVVSYNADPDVADILADLERHGVCVSIYSNDPNITPELISLVFGVKKASVRVLPAKIHAEYQELVRPRESVCAGGVHAGGLPGVQMLLNAAGAVRRSVMNSTIVQLIGVIVGYGLVAFMAFSGSLSSAPCNMLLLYSLAWLAIGCVSAVAVKR